MSHQLNRWIKVIFAEIEPPRIEFVVSIELGGELKEVSVRRDAVVHRLGALGVTAFVLEPSSTDMQFV